MSTVCVSCRLDGRELHRRVLKKKKEEEKLRQDGKLEQMADLIIPLEKVSPRVTYILCVSVHRISVIPFKIVPKGVRPSGNLFYLQKYSIYMC